jgi:hypothetical protein
VIITGEEILLPPRSIASRKFENIKDAFQYEGAAAAAPRYENLGQYMGIHPDERYDPMPPLGYSILQATAFEKIDTDGCKLVWKLSKGVLAEDFASLDALQVFCCYCIHIKNNNAAGLIYINHIIYFHALIYY